MKRRDFLLTAGAIAGTAGLGAAGLGATGLVSGVGPRKAPMPYDLIVQKARYRFTDQSTLGMVSLLPQAPPPVLVGHQGKPMVLNVRNTLPDYTSMHWHGVRIANAMDGVPYLTQMPIATNETFSYAFTPPDAGTYWYHPHCMTMDQMAHGLTGVLVIKEAKDPGFDADQVINLKDFRLNEEGEFLPSFTGRGAARAGTFGNVVTANWQENPVYDQPAGALLRLRVVNTDTTRIHKLYLTTTDARIIAWDGHPVRDPIALPTALKPVFVGPGQRLDFALRMPDSEGQNRSYGITARPAQGHGQPACNRIKPEPQSECAVCIVAQPRGPSRPKCGANPRICLRLVTGQHDRKQRSLWVNGLYVLVDQSHPLGGRCGHWYRTTGAA